MQLGYKRVSSCTRTANQVMRELRNLRRARVRFIEEEEQKKLAKVRGLISLKRETFGGVWPVLAGIQLDWRHHAPMFAMQPEIEEAYGDDIIWRGRQEDMDENRDEMEIPEYDLSRIINYNSDGEDDGRQVPPHNAMDEVD